MRVISLEVNNFRNYPSGKITPSPGINLICGNNAQGKTNLIEAIWLFTGLKSFRCSRDSDIKKFGEKKGTAHLSFFADNREQEADIEIEKNREGRLNGVKLKSVRELVGEFCAVVFSPVHLNIVKEGPDVRRDFIDMAIVQIKPSYKKTLSEYNMCLKMRNAQLKIVNEKSFSGDGYDEALTFLNIINQRIAACGAKVIKERYDYTELLKKESAEIYKGLSGGKEELNVKYSPELKRYYYDEKLGAYTDDKKLKGVVPLEENSENVSLPETARCLILGLEKAMKDDIRLGTTSVGPHRDEIHININSISARSFGSQGQQRSCALAMKLGEAEVLKNKTGSVPVILLDDVMSELDPSRQEYILNKIEDKQVFITCCDLTPGLKPKAGKIFNIDKGVFTFEEEIKAEENKETEG